jgi:predicted Zn finger-like uncharacterized protein
MSLATRCTACGTIFRVVQDQLKVSEGWVRCGRCGEVFNALDGLFDLGQLGPRPASASVPVPDPRLQPGAGEFVASRIPPPAEPIDDEPAVEQAPPPREDEFVASINPAPVAIPDFGAAIGARRGDHDDFVDARFPSEFPPGADDEPAAAPADLRMATPSFEAEPYEPPHDEGAPTIHAAEELMPAFVREADRAARWSRPGVRAALVAGVLGLLATLGLQLGLHYRDHVAARWPQSQPMLAALCAPLGCQVEPLRRIHALVVDGSALNRVANGSGYRLELLLRNRDAMPVAMPAVDLQLSDASGAVLARRVLMPEQFGVGAATDVATTVPVELQPGRELPLQLSFNAGGARVAGYSIELFYP